MMDMDQHRLNGEAETFLSYAVPGQTRRQRAVIKAIESISGHARLHRLYNQYCSEREAPEYSHETFFDSALRLLNVNVRYDRAMLKSVPRDKPVLFIANHPFGVIDGIILTWLALKARPDVKVVTINALNRAPEVRPYCLPVDFSGTPEGNAITIATRRAATAALANNGSIAIFPAGGVATAQPPFLSPARDLPWIGFTARLVSIPDTWVVPIHFSGQNSLLFHMASRMGQTMRASMFCHETVRKIGKRIDVTIGAPIAPEDLADVGDRTALVAELRRRTFALAGRPDVDWMKTSAPPEY